MLKVGNRLPLRCSGSRANLLETVASAWPDLCCGEGWSLRIAVDGRCIGDHFPGIGRYAYNLCRSLSGVGAGHTFFLLYDPTARNSRFALAELASLPNIKLRPVNAGIFSVRSQVSLPLILQTERIDVYHSPYYVRPYAAFVPTVVTLHDAIPVMFPEDGLLGRSRLAFTLATKLTIATATRIIVGSETAGRDFRRLLGVPPEKVKTIYHAVDERFRPFDPDAIAMVRHRLGLPSKFLLHVGINKPHKNLARLIEAFSRLEDSETALVLAGPEDQRYHQPRELVERLGLQCRVRFLGLVDEESLPGLYAAATAFVFPSLYEGFGLPVLEAMASGTPVLCSSASCLPEVVGGAAVLVDPLDTDAWAAAMTRIVKDGGLRAEMRRRGLARAAEFSWEKTARATLEVYGEVGKG